MGRSHRAAALVVRGVYLTLGTAAWLLGAGCLLALLAGWVEGRAAIESTRIGLVAMAGAWLCYRQAREVER